jgi:hypothetical protein
MIALRQRRRGTLFDARNSRLLQGEEMSGGGRNTSLSSLEQALERLKARGDSI